MYSVSTCHDSGRLFPVYAVRIITYTETTPGRRQAARRADARTTAAEKSTNKTLRRISRGKFRKCFPPAVHTRSHRPPAVLPAAVLFFSSHAGIVARFDFFQALPRAAVAFLLILPAAARRGPSFLCQLLPSVLPSLLPSLVPRPSFPPIFCRQSRSPRRVGPAAGFRGCRPSFPCYTI